jgi:hypothetical protein
MDPPRKTPAKPTGAGYSCGMKRLLAALLVTALPAWGAAPTGCATLCGSWQLDTTLSAAVEPVLDAALAEYKQPREKRIPTAKADDMVGQIEEEMERSLGPIRNRPGRDVLRDELLQRLTVPRQLNLDGRGEGLAIQGDGTLSRRIAPGTPHSRVDSNGTAKIHSSWKSGALVISEKYSRRNSYTETYALQRSDATLLVTREVRRPGMKILRIRSVYRRA